jgi:hypothetical protein
MKEKADAALKEIQRQYDHTFKKKKTEVTF